MKNTKEINGVNTGPINLVVPNTIEVKMQAISNLSEAILSLSKAINGVNFQATISNNTITTPQGGVGISIK